MDQATTELKATDAHATIQKLEADNLHLQLLLKAECKKKWGVNIESCILTCPEGLAAWEQYQAEVATCEAEKATKTLEKDTAKCVRTTEHIHKAVLQVFDLPLTAYRKKEELHVLALELDDQGKVVDLQQHIKVQMQAQSELANNPRFAGLYADKWPCAVGLLLEMNPKDSG
ncbi:hypothetical protein K439DRAFT_1373997 [Ramaria rubella]|nr:hypothetical protein K439DRAFT_1373997 [Ramaria rubella]